MLAVSTKVELHGIDLSEHPLLRISGLIYCSRPVARLQLAVHYTSLV
jgi:hypothetical protein